MYFFNYSFGQRVLCNGLLWGHIWQLFTDREQQSGEVLEALIDLCVMRILRFSLRFAVSLFGTLALDFFFHTNDYIFR